MGAMDAGAGSFDQYHSNWVVTSGLKPNSSIAHDHRILLQALWLGMVYDQVNVCNSAMGEQIIRRLIQHEMAVEKDSKHPDYSGLNTLLYGSVEEKGRASAPKFTKWVSERQAVRAQILKQARLLREEKSAEEKRRKKGKGKGGDKSDPSKEDA